jgi:hypothetical protein
VESSADLGARLRRAIPHFRSCPWTGGRTDRTPVRGPPLPRDTPAGSRVHLPTSVSTVIVRIGGEFVERFEPGIADGERRFGLAAR